MLDAARRLGLAVQVNTMVTRRNLHQLDAIAALLEKKGIAMWSVFFLAPVGRGFDEPRISAEEYEMAFKKLYGHSVTMPYAVKTTEASHYRRFVLQRGGHPLASPGTSPGAALGARHRAPLGAWHGRGVMFVSHVGEIYPVGSCL
jgi:MoaA/NifB/PqqE/SkfB family radical SAM enzyme